MCTSFVTFTLRDRMLRLVVNTICLMHTTAVQIPDHLHLGKFCWESVNTECFTFCFHKGFIPFGHTRQVSTREISFGSCEFTIHNKAFLLISPNLRPNRNVIRLFRLRDGVPLIGVHKCSTYKYRYKNECSKHSTRSKF